MKTLQLTSPMMRGPDVKAAQARLNGNNVLKKDWFDCKVDGVFGQCTARSCKRAKYWLGYRQVDIKGTYGDQLNNFLSGKTPLTQEMKNRRKARLAIAQQTPIRVKAFNELIKHVGQTEKPPGSNNFPWATTWYGITGPWCAMAVSHAYVIAGSKSFKAGNRYAYVPYIVNDARAGRNYMATTKTPQNGDLVCFDWDKDGIADHVGLFDKWLNTSKTLFATCEGNTSSSNSGSQSNGGGVFRRERKLSDVIAFVHVGTPN